MAIKSFGDKATAEIYHQSESKETKKRYALAIRRATRRKLLMIAAAEKLGDLKQPPGNHLES